MKKLVVFLLTVVNYGALIALPIGNSTEAGLFTNGVFIFSYGCYDLCDPCFKWYQGLNVRAGFYGDYVFNRHMEVEGFTHADIDKTEINTNAGYLVLDFCNRFDLFATLGRTHLEFSSNITAFSPGDEGKIEVSFPSHFSWSVGARATLWELGCIGFGSEGQYFRTCFDADVMYDEWQVGVGMSYRFEIDCPDIALVPYLGVSWSRARLHVDDSDPEIFDLISKKPWGYSIGASLTFCEIIGLSVEGRFASEKAVYVNGQMRF